jgi:hypothetical protein
VEQTQSPFAAQTAGRMFLRDVAAESTMRALPALARAGRYANLPLTPIGFSVVCLPFQHKRVRSKRRRISHAGAQYLALA